MAHHYAGVDPDEAAQYDEIDDETNMGEVAVPGKDHSYDIEAMFEVDRVMQGGELVPASEVAERNRLTEFLEDFDGDEEVLGTFLAYSENEWGRDELWLNSDYSRTSVYQNTAELEQNYGLIEQSPVQVKLTDKGRKIGSAFETLSEDERILNK